MSLADQRNKARDKRQTGTPCSIGEVYRKLADQPDEIVELNALLYEDGLSGREVYEDLTADGHKVGSQSVNRHRGRDCRCFKHEDWACRGCRYDKAHCACSDADAA